jgi:hypothetical protein
MAGQAVVGGAAGALRSVSQETSAGHQATLRRIVDDLQPSALLAQSLVAALSQSPRTNSVITDLATAPKHADSHLRIALAEAALIADQNTSNPPMRLALAIRVQWVRAADGTVVYENEFRYRGARERTLGIWSQNNGQLLRVELQRICPCVGERMARVLWVDQEQWSTGFYCEVPD